MISCSLNDQPFPGARPAWPADAGAGESCAELLFIDGGYSLLYIV